MASSYPCARTAGESLTGPAIHAVELFLNGTSGQVAQDVLFGEREKLVARWERRAEDSRKSSCQEFLVGCKVHVEEITHVGARTIKIRPGGYYSFGSLLTRLGALFAVLGAKRGVPAILLQRNNSLDHWLAKVTIKDVNSKDAILETTAAGNDGKWKLSPKLTSDGACRVGECNSSALRYRVRVHNLTALANYVEEHERNNAAVREASLRFARAQQVPLLIVRYEDVERNPTMWQDVVFPFLGWRRPSSAHANLQKRVTEAHSTVIVNYADVATALGAAGFGRYLRDELDPEARRVESLVVRSSGVVRESTVGMVDARWTNGGT